MNCKINFFLPRVLASQKFSSDRENNQKKNPKKRKITQISRNDIGKIGSKCNHALSKFSTIENNLWRESFFADITTKEIHGIKQSSRDQRFSTVDEPICCICGKYGEYICDQTEADVCSKECKSLNLLNIRLRNYKSKEPEEAATARSTLGVVLDTLPTAPAADPFPSASAPPDLDELEPGSSGSSAAQAQEIAPLPLHGTFRESGLFHDTLVENLELCGYHSPTPFQAQGLVCGMLGRDFVCNAPAGLGKTMNSLLITLARLLPLRYTYPDHVLALILAPTRELCLQIENQAKKLLKGIWNTRTATIIGGVPLPQQVYRIKRGVQLVVATPGRLNDMMEKEPAIVQKLLLHLAMVMVDEADEIFSRGFKKQFETLVAQILQTSTQTPQWIFSSIDPCQEAEDFCASPSCRNGPAFLLKMDEDPRKPVLHEIVWVPNKEKANRLCDLFHEAEKYKTPAVVFVSRRMGCELLAQSLSSMLSSERKSSSDDNRCPEAVCTFLHGEMEQTARSEAMQKFSAGTAKIMVATDIAARGLDFEHVRLIVNFDLPSNAKSLTRRIGGSGSLMDRHAVSFINEGDRDIFPDLLSDASTAKVALGPETLSRMNSTLKKDKVKQQKKRKKTTLSDKEIEKRVHENFSIEATNLWKNKWKFMTGKKVPKPKISGVCKK